ncbi:molybdopterin converting factor subunit 1 [Hydrogenothermus marinus]|uniref:Molybdopterin synthase sulfur carrier subunit n=1 Tax=Hydrogenothermus marinus TaxID=133270 RepID=A0A3M0BG50_9AQUI|nr:molybdopterin converting factor subunit 1 [Hydrogenothermus marinus]RMA96007.1 molybdopterin synthase sulfur carrier subunit [Hydrogenothermus marinus]
MKIKLLYFSSIKDKLKKSSEELEIKDNSSINDLINILKEKYPQISQNLDNVMFAVNEEYQDKEYILKDGDNVAVIPPVSGG